MKTLVQTTARKLGVSSERVFKLAYHYWEIRRSKDFIMIQFLKWSCEDKNCNPVEDYCLDVLAGRTK